MVKITAQMVKDLRAATGAGPLDSKKALEANDGDMQAAIDFLREKNIATANKKLNKERTMNEGVVAMYQSDDKKVGALAWVACETDFVSSNDIFQKFAEDVVNHVAHNNPASVEDMLGQTFYDGDGTIEDMLKETVTEIGEKSEIAGIARFEAADDGSVEIYQHFNKQIAAMVEISDAAKADTGYDIAMHVSNLKPAYLTRDEVPADVVDHEKQVQLNRAIEEGKPEHIAEKVVQGRMGKFYEEIVLLEQKFLKDDSKSIEQLLKENGIEVKSMARFAVGENDEEDGEGDE
ncbi:MAG: translation elongation factor Ts [Chloroflexota bacterium]